MVVHFQPIVDLAQGVITGFEALSRFPGQEGFSPDRVFGAAEQIGSLLPLEEIVVAQALAARAHLPENCFLSINMTAAFLLSPHWRKLVRASSGLSGVVLELTEQQAISDYTRVREALADVQRAGGMVAVDDAGAGYASLKHVLEIKPDFIKLDRIFVQDCHHDPAKAALIEMIGRAGSRMDSWIIAEGIEEHGELGELCRLGVPLGQGYLLGRPQAAMPASTILDLPGQRPSDFTSGCASLGPHMMQCLAYAGIEQAQQSMHASPNIDVAAVVDAFKRPLVLFERHPHLGVRALPELMISQLSTDPVEVLRRALTRSAATRFDPFAVIDSHGVFQGIVRVDRLMRGILHEPSL